MKLKKNDEPSTREKVKITGTVTHGSGALAGKIFQIHATTDISSISGVKSSFQTECTSATTVSYSLENLPEGVYYITCLIMISGQVGDPLTSGVDFVGHYPVLGAPTAVEVAKDQETPNIDFTINPWP